jgi:Carboxypeptidase regulatory-like domain
MSPRVLRVLPTAMLLMSVVLWTSAQPLAQSATPQAEPVANAAVAGVVVDQHSKLPVRGAVVRLNQPDGRGLTRTVTADEGGRFQIVDLPAGDYVLSSTHAGYLPTTLGEQRLGGPGTPVVVRDGEMRDEITIPMSRGGVITGRVVDEQGDPVPAVQVSALQYRFDAGAHELRPVFFDRTDDRGEYRLFTLPAGEYYVSAEPGAPSQLIRPPGAGMPLLPGAPAFSGVIATYYPNSATAARARSVSVVEGQETARVNIALVAAKAARVHGRVVTGSGEPFSRAVVILQSRSIGVMPFMNRTSMAREDGSFDMLDVPPGDYVVTVRPIGGAGDPETARADVTVAGNDIDDLLLVAERGASVRGTITTDSGDPVPLQPSQVTVRLLPVRGGATIPIAVQPNFAFEARSVFGSYRLASELVGSVGLWAAKAIRWNGEDITNRVLDLRGGDVVDQLEIVLSDRWATLSGVLRDEHGIPIGDAPLVLFPADETLWIPGTRHIRGMRTDYQGRYGVSWLFAGEYLLAAPDAMAPDQWNDPRFLRSLVERAARLTLSDEDDRMLDLRVRR